MPPSVSIALVTLVAILVVMAGEAALSTYNESVLRTRGAVEPPGDVYRVMRWAYPASFAAMAVEGAMAGPSPPNVLAAGLAIFGAAKALKMWAISSLGLRWTFRVLVLPDAPLVASGPYRFLRHPNYLAVIGEFAGAACIVCAPIAGVLSIVGFGYLIQRRVAIEDRALGRE